jgi:hypothetical protein
MIIAEFFDRKDAYDYEQDMIHEHWGDPLCINQFYTMAGRRMWGCDNFGRKHPNRKPREKYKLKSPRSGEHKHKISQAKLGVAQGPNPLKGRPGELNGMYGKPHAKKSMDKLRYTRSLRTTDQNLQSYSRVKSQEEIAKLKTKIIYKVCRLKDGKEMSVANFFKYLKLKPHLF